MTAKRVAVVGTGISGLAAAWLLSKRHHVVLYERENRIGGHSNTVVAQLREADGNAVEVPVDTGFIVYNTASYPNLIALFEQLDVPTAPTSMSFAVSLDDGAYEYSGSGLGGLFSQRRNLMRPSHWRMVSDILSFFRRAERDVGDTRLEQLSLREYLHEEGYGPALVDRHILPMAAAIWSTPCADVLAFPAASFVRFFSNHGLLQVSNRPAWRTVQGGSREYVSRILAAIGGDVRSGDPVVSVQRRDDRVLIRTASGATETYDDVVLATHADEALALLDDPDSAETALLSQFRYVPNEAVLHTDPAHMPRRRRAWSSWNYVARQSADGADLSLSYWMNSLQPLPTSRDVFVTLNPTRPLAAEHEIARFQYTHPLFDAGAMAAQRTLWSLQGRRRTWFCGSYFGYGFHEDGAESGLAVAEQLGAPKRPWEVPAGSTRIHVTDAPQSIGAQDVPVVSGEVEQPIIVPGRGGGRAPSHAHARTRPTDVVTDAGPTDAG